jgi:hypothetical protein
MTNSVGITPTPSAREDIREIPLNTFERIALAKLCQEKMTEAIQKGSFESEKDWRELQEKITGR